MTSHITLTSQGQISIPAEVRRLLGINLRSLMKMTVNKERNEIILVPARDITSFRAKFADRKLKGNGSLGKTIEQENKVIGEAVTKKHLKK